MNTRGIVRGAEAIADFLGSGMEPVSQAQAQWRADICAGCPMNKPAKGWMRLVGPTVARIAKLHFQLKDKLALRVEREETLGVCDACLCPLKLKVHVPLDHIMSYTDPKTFKAFHANCWIRKEQL